MPLNLKATSAAAAGTAYRVLREQVRSGQLHPGHPLTESRTAADLNASAAVVGEAFAMLARDGLVNRGPFGGYEVSAPTLKSVDDFFPAWRLVGPELVRLGIQRASAPQIRAMQEIIADFAFVPGLCLPDRVSSFYAHASPLFELLTAAGDSELLADAYRGMAEEMARFWYLPVAEAAAQCWTLPPIREGLGTAIGRRDADLAAESAGDFITATHARARQLARSCDVISLDRERARRRAGGTWRTATRTR